MKYLDIFIAFFRSGMLGYGGGPSAIPLVHREVVKTFKWMTDDEFSDVLALGNTLPGPINTKMAGYIGYRVGGLLGMLTAIFASIIPTILLMIILLTSLTSFKDKEWVQGMTRAVLPVVGVMLATLTWDFFKNAKKGLGLTPALILGAVSILLLQWAGVHPGILVAVLLAAAFVKRDKKKERGTS